LPPVALFSDFLELIFAYAAEGAGPVIGEVLESDIVVLGGIIDITTNVAHVFLHFCIS
jgi:hypothetical protein